MRAWSNSAQHHDMKLYGIFQTLSCCGFVVRKAPPNLQYNRNSPPKRRHEIDKKVSSCETAWVIWHTSPLRQAPWERAETSLSELWLANRLRTGIEASGPIAAFLGSLQLRILAKTTARSGKVETDEGWWRLQLPQSHSVSWWGLGFTQTTANLHLHSAWNYPKSLDFLLFQDGGASLKKRSHYSFGSLEF